MQKVAKRKRRMDWDDASVFSWVEENKRLIIWSIDSIELPED